MAIEDEVAQLVTATTALLTSVNVSKATLDEKVVLAETAEATATDAAAAAAGRASSAAVSAGAAKTSEVAAAKSAADAVAVVTGGTASLTPAPGKLPLADSEGHIADGWLPAALTSTPNHTGPALQFAAGKTLRIYHGGTSIEANSNSATRQFIASLTKQYGDSGNTSTLLGALGGGYENAWSGWKKQPYGGALFTRLRGEAASTAFTLRGYGSRFTLRYSTEADGGSFDVWIDGAFSQTLSCNGAQSVNNEYSWTFAEGHHTIEFKPPASGYVYLEVLEYCLDKPGIQMFDAAYGGSALANMTGLRTPVGAQVAGIPIVGYSALDGMFANVAPNYKPDLFIVGWTVNDAGMGMGSFNTAFKPSLQRIVDTTRTLNVPLLLIIEMGGHYTMPADPGYATFAAIRAFMRSFINEAHVTVIDWHQAAGGDTLTIAQFAARYYPTATFNEATGAVTGGDFVHPNDKGYAVLSEQLAVHSGVPGLGRSQESEPVWYQRIRQKGPLIGANTVPVDSELVNIGGQRTEVNNLGFKYRYDCVGYSSNINAPLRANVPLYSSRDEVNLDPVINNLIAASATADKYGKYLQLANQFYYIKPLGLGSVAPVLTGVNLTLTLVVGPGNWTVQARDYNNTVYLEQFAKGVSIGFPGQAIGKNETDTPQILHLTIRPGSQFYSNFTGKIYAAYWTATNFPCLPLRETFKLREIGSPLYMAADTPSNQVQVGQTYLEAVNGKTVEKVCIGARVYKVNDSKFYGLYRVQNRTLAGLIANPPLNGVVTLDAYNESFGGTPQVTNAASPMCTIPQQAWVAEAVYTLTGKVSGFTAMAITMVNSSTNNTLFYNPATNLWVSAGSYIGFNILEGEQFAVTMTLPTAAQLNGLPFRMDIRQNGGAGSASKWGVLSLVDGNSACI